MNTHQFVINHHIRLEATLIDERPDKLMSDMPDGSSHWKCVLRRGKRQFTVYFSQGPSICKEPTADDVLDCVASDCSGVDNNDFEAWASDLGYDTDSRKAERIYNACQSSAQRLYAFLGAELYNALLYEAERL